jgi:glutamate/tyrosine decarboxylase-like PLP-dependent enzyme
MGGLTALHAARVRALGRSSAHDPSLRVYLTGEAHSSLAKSLRILGFGEAQSRVLPTDDKLAMDVCSLERAIEADGASGARPFAVIATAGTTSTGAIDPIAAIRAICDAHNLWLHVDGAYGGAARFGTRGPASLADVGLADSLVLDPHKWLFQPYEIGCVLVREAGWLKAAFAVEAEYLREAATAASPDGDGLAGSINFYDYGPQLTRSFRALKLWMFLKTFGFDAVAAAIDRGIALAEEAERLIDGAREWELVTPAQIGIVTFRSAKSASRTPAAMKAVTAAGLERGYALITTTEVRGETVFRLCTIHPDARIDEIGSALQHLAAEIEASD